MHAVRAIRDGQHRFGHERNSRFGADEVLPLGETILPEVLSGEGCVSGFVGKWYLGDAPRFRPRQRGFDEFLGYLGVAKTTSVPRTATHRR